MTGRRTRFLLVALALAAPLAPAATRAGPPDQDFQAAENTFRFQDYKTAERLLSDLLYPEIRLINPDQVVKAREYLGACYYWIGDEKRMEEEFTVLLTLAPSYKLDPFYYPVPLIERFDVLRKRLSDLHMLSTDPPRPRVPTEPARCERVEETIVQRSNATVFLPFGVGQFANGHTVKGVLFLTGETLALGANIGTYVAAERLRGADGLYSRVDADRARTLRIIQYSALGAFVGLAVWGIVDAALGFQPEQRSVKVGPCPAPDPGGAGSGPGSGVRDGGMPLSLCVSYR